MASCPSSCSTATRGSSAKLLPDLTQEERDRYVELNAAAVRAELLPADLVFANHVLLGGPVGVGERRALRGQGARLRARVLDAREPRAAGVGEGVARRSRGRLRRLAAHPPGARGGRRSRRARPRGPARRGRRRVPPRAARQGAPRATRGGSPRPAERTATSASRTTATPSASPSSSPTRSRRSSTSGSCSTTRASTCCSRRSASSTRAP